MFPEIDLTQQGLSTPTCFYRIMRCFICMSDIDTVSWSVNRTMTPATMWRMWYSKWGSYHACVNETWQIRFDDFSLPEEVMACFLRWTWRLIHMKYIARMPETIFICNTKELLVHLSCNSYEVHVKFAWSSNHSKFIWTSYVFHANCLWTSWLPRKKCRKAKNKNIRISTSNYQRYTKFASRYIYFWGWQIWWY